MRTKTLLIIFLALSTTIFGSETDTIQTGVFKRKAISLSTSLSYGNESCVSSRIEYQAKFGKLNLKAEIGTTKGGILMDIGVGYGYPILLNKSHALFVNGTITYINIGLKSVLYGPTTMLDLEYRRTWNHFSFCLAPFYRRIFIENPEIGIVHNKNLYGLRVGAIYSFWLK